MRIICNVDHNCWNWGHFIRCPSRCYINSFIRYCCWCWWLRLSHSHVSISIWTCLASCITHIFCTFRIPPFPYISLFVHLPFLTPSFLPTSHFLVLPQAFDKEMQQVRMFRLTDIAFVANLVTYTIPFHCKVQGDGSTSNLFPSSYDTSYI